MPQIPPEQMTFAKFRERLHTRFQVTTGAGGVDLELTEVVLAQSSPASDASAYESFALIFEGPARPRLDQGIHRMRSERGEQLDLFIVPVGPSAAGLRYEAVFNRLRSPG